MIMNFNVCPVFSLPKFINTDSLNVMNSKDGEGKDISDNEENVGRALHVSDPQVFRTFSTKRASPSISYYTGGGYLTLP